MGALAKVAEEGYYNLDTAGGRRAEPMKYCVGYIDCGQTKIKHVAGKPLDEQRLVVRGQHWA